MSDTRIPLNDEEKRIAADIEPHLKALITGPMRGIHPDLGVTDFSISLFKDDGGCHVEIRHDKALQAAVGAVGGFLSGMSIGESVPKVIAQPQTNTLMTLTAENFSDIAVAINESIRLQDIAPPRSTSALLGEISFTPHSPASTGKGNPT